MSHFLLPECGVGIQNFRSTVLLNKDLDYQALMYKPAVWNLYEINLV